MNTMRALLVGCGSISRTWLKAVPGIPGLAVVGLVDVDESRARSRAAEFGLDNAGVHADLGAALEQARPDVVFDCTVPEARVKVIPAALAAGCHVLCEKPLADSLENARRIVEASRRAGRVCAVMQNRRFLPDIARLKALAESGRIGRLTGVDADFYLGAHFGGFRDRMEHVLLLDMAIHHFDMARFISGADPVSVYCREWNPAGSWYDHDANAVAIFEMSNGAVFTYRGSWCAEGMNTSWEADWRVTGERGTAVWRGDGALRAEAVAQAGGFRSELTAVEFPPGLPRYAGGHAGLLADFVRCLRDGREPETVCHDNLRSLAMVFGAIRSATERREVAVSEWLRGR